MAEARFKENLSRARVRRSKGRLVGQFILNQLFCKPSDSPGLAFSTDISFMEVKGSSLSGDCTIPEGDFYLLEAHTRFLKIIQVFCKADIPESTQGLILEDLDLYSVFFNAFQNIDVIIKFLFDYRLATFQFFVR